jgi:hypothetical protein
MANKKKAGTEESTTPRIPEHVRPLIRRLMMPGAEPLYSTEWDLVRAYDQTIQGQGGKKAGKKPRKKKPQ